MFDCEPSEVLVGNGAAELIKGLFVALEGDVGIIYPTFNEYPERIGEHRVKRFIPKNKDFTYTIEELKEFSEGLGALVLINPDNPSGHFFKKEEVLELVEYLGERDIRFIFDESFIDFANRDEVYTLLISKYLQRYKNLIVIKSISKSYGVPGIRLGVLASSDMDLVNKVRKEVSIWNINSFGEHFLQIISKYKKDYNKACDLINDERNRFFHELSKISFLRVLPSRANYFLCEVTAGYTATKLTEELLNKYNILIKDCTGKIGFENGEYIRVAVRNKEDNNFLVEKLREVY
ncbi:Threonine-phosphate decarboxylase [bioreactor metagenome]|uniref:Threonine-phosphate decarboxylase n=1 Tax=bioreactor metagenome TaxID=1076179 RepID=A0A645BHJ6_9ZZZZ